MKIGFIGMGNMGYAMLKGASIKIDKESLTYTDISQELLEEVKKATDIDYCRDNISLVKNVDIIILAIKPQYYGTVLDEIKACVKSNQIILSIAPGITIDYIKSIIIEDVRVVRSMPNTPALVLEGMSVVSYSNDVYLDIEKAEIKMFFESFSRYIEMSEEQLDMVVPVSGSSPAYGFIMIEAMADAAVLIGLPRKVAYELAAQSMLGAAKMVLESGTHPGVLKDAVCSPGGTTIAAVKVLEEKGFRSAVIEAMVACYDKVKEFK